MDLISRVREFDPPYRLIVPTQTGSKRIADESFRGPLGLLQGTLIPNKLHRPHQIFLEELKEKAELKSTRRIR